MDGEIEGGKVWFTDESGDERSQEVFHKSGDDRPESRADNHGDRKVDDIAAEEKLPEALSHIARDKWSGGYSRCIGGKSQIVLEVSSSFPE